ncbi:MAG: DUF2231 domain-containing protein [Fidelibacterota bacterium]
MNALLPEWLPNVHPLIIHFPIVLIFFAWGIHLLTLIWPRVSLLIDLDYWLYGLGIVAAWVAFLTGRFGANELEIAPQTVPILNQHADLAQWTALIFTLVFGLLMIQKLIPLWQKVWGRPLIFIVSTIGLVTLVLTADRGGRLVFEQGVGVVAIQKELPAETSLTTPTGNGLQRQANGTLTWIPAQGDPEKAFNGFHFLLGDVESLKMLPGKDAVQVEGEGPILFTVGNTVDGVQVELVFNSEQFQGALSVLHHVQDRDNYEYVTVRPGHVVLGRVVRGANRILDRSPVSLMGMDTLRVVGAGSHFKGYVNGKLLLHGHAKAQPPGDVGLKLDGKGNLAIAKFEVVVIE